MRAVVMAGGESSRMGREKALMHYTDKTLIEYSLDAIAGIEGDPLVVSNNGEVRDFLKGIEVIPDFLVGRGPLGGIHAAIKHTHDDIIMVACDTPLLKPTTVNALVDQRGDAEIAVYVDEGKIFPFPGIYAAELLPELEKRLEGAGRDLSLQDFIRTTSGVSYAEIGDELKTIVGVNTPDDFRRLTGLYPAE